MSFIESLHHKREELARVLKQYKGIRRTVEELYPDSAHFIYELLQNAEDVGATDCSFVLEKNGLVFEHNGRGFSEDDVEAITNIGEGTKADEVEKIGRFGVGFKAVFAYSETPHIWSPTFSFKISDFVLPSEIPVFVGLEERTRFEFPFDNPKKTPEDAYGEVSAGLDELAETTLLFLSHIESIRWTVDKVKGEVLRIAHSVNHIEVLRQTQDRTISASHFLRFTEPVAEIAGQRVAIAFALDFLPDISNFNPKTAIAKQLHIVPANPGRVAVFFPAEKETSGLLFHLHAPFVPELSRASVKESASNIPLFEQLAGLSGRALHIIRDLKLLRGEFLSVLPNSQDMIPERYQPIRAAIVREMNEKSLTPTKNGRHAPAAELLQGKASLKELIGVDDLKFFINDEPAPAGWAIGVTQKNSRQDRFLSDLAIRNWDIDKLVEELQWRFADAPTWIRPSMRRVDGPDEASVRWLKRKSLEWHQQLYATFYRELSEENDCYSLKSVRIVKLGNGKYSIGANCFFPSLAGKKDRLFPRVDLAVITSGKNRKLQQDARRFLEAVGVREVDERVEIETILNIRYREDSPAVDYDTHIADLTRFISFVKKEPAAASLFEDYYIFQSVEDRRCPSGIYLDSPFIETGLSSYYDSMEDECRPVALSTEYLKTKLQADQLCEFAVTLGAATNLEIIKVSCRNNPQALEFFFNAEGNWSNEYGVNSDYTIEDIDEFLGSENEAASRLLWNTLCVRKDKDWLTAKYRNNSNYNVKTAPSQLVCTLRDLPWVPQTDGRFVRPSAASASLLPDGFPFDSGAAWLKAIEFGTDENLSLLDNSAMATVAKELGFQDDETLKQAKRFALLPPDERQRFWTEFEQRQNHEFPSHEPHNPDRRSARVGEHAGNAPQRRVEERIRSVSIGRESVKSETEQYLRQQYTDDDEVMFCQICKEPMPFKLVNGVFYFEKVEFLRDLKLRHYQNYLALCPNHAAMFQFANGSDELLAEMFASLETDELEIILAERDVTVRFTKTHIADLKTIIEIDRSS